MASVIGAEQRGSGNSYYLYRWVEDKSLCLKLSHLITQLCLAQLKEFANWSLPCGFSKVKKTIVLTSDEKKGYQKNVSALV